MTVNGSKEIITFGASLSRRMEPFEVMAHLEHLDGNRAVGIVHLAIMPSYHPTILNVEAWLEDGTKPIDAAKALQVAHERVRTIYQLGPPPKLRVVDPSNSNAQHIAQQLVDRIRAARVRSPSIHSFDLSREQCVREVTMALAGRETVDG